MRKEWIVANVSTFGGSMTIQCYLWLDVMDSAIATCTTLLSQSWHIFSRWFQLGINVHKLFFLRVRYRIGSGPGHHDLWVEKCWNETFQACFLLGLKKSYTDIAQVVNGHGSQMLNLWVATAKGRYRSSDFIFSVIHVSSTCHCIYLYSFLIYIYMMFVYVFVLYYVFMSSYSCGYVTCMQNNYSQMAEWSNGLGKPTRSHANHPIRFHVCFCHRLEIVARTRSCSLFGMTLWYGMVLIPTCTDAASWFIFEFRSKKQFNTLQPNIISKCQSSKLAAVFITFYFSCFLGWKIQNLTIFFSTGWKPIRKLRFGLWCSMPCAPLHWQHRALTPTGKVFCVLARRWVSLPWALKKLGDPAQARWENCPKYYPSCLDGPRCEKWVPWWSEEVLVGSLLDGISNFDVSDLVRIACATGFVYYFRIG